jgi:TetR/AcrR family transcriptional regulator
VQEPITTSQHAPTRPRPRRKGEITAERILDAAEAQFAERGFAGTTLRHVATAVGIRTPSLYNHFASKDALYAAVLERGIRPVLMALTAARLGESDPARLGAELMRQLAERPLLPRLIQHETLAGGERLSPALREWMEPLFSQADEMVASGPAAKRWEPEQLPLLVIAMYNVVVGYFSVAPLYEKLNGADLLSPVILERQTRLFGELVNFLFGPRLDAGPGSAGSPAGADEQAP